MIAEMDIEMENKNENEISETVFLDPDQKSPRAQDFEERVIRMPREISIVPIQRYFTYCVIAMFALNGLCALALIFLVGSGKLILPEKLIMTVLLETVAQAAAVFVIVARYHFPSCTACYTCSSKN